MTEIPFEIQAEIMKKLPIKSLIQFRAVSKSWMSVIDSSNFITTYSSNDGTQNHHHLHVRYVDIEDATPKYVSIVDDAGDSFPLHQFAQTVPVSVKRFENYSTPIVGYSRGLFCFYNYHGKPRDFATVILWNPAIKRSVDIIVPNVFDTPYLTVVGFGVCKVTHISSAFKYNTIANIPSQVEVFTLSSGAWSAPSCSSSSSSSCGNMPRKSIAFTQCHVAIHEFIYWHAYDRVIVDGEFELLSNLIMSFDMTSEEFKEICLPESLARSSFPDLYICKLKDSLVVLQSATEADKQVCDVWIMIMVHDVTRSFTKLFTVSTPDVSIERVLGFRNSSEPIIATRVDSEDWFEPNPICLYDPNSNSVNHIGITGQRFSCSASSYVETLLLLNY